MLIGGVVKRLLVFVLITGLAVVLSSCSTGNVTSPPSQGQAQFSSGALQAPGATIVVQGKQYSGSAPVKTNDLVGVVLNGKTYLLFTSSATAGQNLALSDKLSDQAVADFIAQPMLQTMSQTGLSTQAAYDETLPDGIGVSGLSAGSGAITFANLKDRWIAVQPGNGGQSSFVPPQTWLNLDTGGIISAAIDKNVTELLVNTTSTSMPRQASFQTYGSVVRALAFPPNMSFIDQASLKQAYDANPTLFMELNGVDFLDILTAAVQHVVDFDPSGCLSGAVSGGLDAFRASGFGLLKQDTAAITTASAGLATTTADLAQCIATASTGGTDIPVVGTAKEIIHVIGTLSWVGNLEKGAVDSAFGKYYAQLNVAPMVSFLAGTDHTGTGTQLHLGAFWSFTSSGQGSLSVTAPGGNQVYAVNPLPVGVNAIEAWVAAPQVSGDYTLTFNALGTTKQVSLYVNFADELALPAPISVDVATASELAFSWPQVSGAKVYNVGVRENATNAQVAYTTVTSPSVTFTSNDFQQPLDPAKQYYVYIEALSLAYPLTASTPPQTWNSSENSARFSLQ